MTNRQIRRITQKEERRSKGKRPDRRAATRERATFREFLGEVRAELKRVSWPTRQEVATFTAVTLITSVSLTLIIFGMDILFKATILELIRSL